jgi:hypothetical protein
LADSAREWHDLRTYAKCDSLELQVFAFDPPRLGRMISPSPGLASGPEAERGRGRKRARKIDLDASQKKALDLLKEQH